MPRWITITKAPFDYWHSRASATQFSANGEFFVKDEIADFAVAKGYATEGKPVASKAKSRKGKSPRRRKTATPKADAATDTRSDASLAGKGLAADDSTAVRSGVDSAAEQR